MSTEVEGEGTATGVLVVVEGNVAANQLDRDEARQLTDEIREHLTLGFGKLAVARQRRADIALGYASWWLYVDAEFGDLRYLGLPPEERGYVVESMHRDKMSQRAIAERMDVSVGTVNSDLRKLGAQTTKVTGKDGKEYESTRERKQPFVRTPGMSKRAEVVARVKHAGEQGMTCRELEIATGWHHGVASSPLSAVAGKQRVVRTGERRLGYAVYVAPEEVIEAELVEEVIAD